MKIREEQKRRKRQGRDEARDDEEGKGSKETIECTMEEMCGRL